MIYETHRSFSSYVSNTAENRSPVYSLYGGQFTATLKFPLEMLELMAGNARRRTVILSLNVAIGVALLFATPRSVLQPKAAQCNPPAFLQAGDPAYVDAMELAQTLRSRGFTVKCVLRSTMEGAFEGLEGAALYRTDRGESPTPSQAYIAGLQSRAHQTRHTTRLGCPQLGDVAIPDTFANALE